MHLHALISRPDFLLIRVFFCELHMEYIFKQLLQALCNNKFLQVIYLLCYSGYSLPEGEIIPLSGACKSGAGSIAQAAG